MKEYFLRMMADATSEPSAKRWAAFFAFVAGIAFGVCGRNEAAYACLSFAGVCLGVTPLEKK